MKARLMNVLLSSLLIGVLTSAGAPAASGSPQSIAAVKPVIGPPVAVPAQPLPGARFTVSFKVTRSDTRARLTSGTMIGVPSVAGKVIGHARSFKAGTARLSFIVPTSAEGKLLKVKVTIKAGGQSATRVATFRVKQRPSISIGDSSVAEGSSGAATLSVPVTLSTASTSAVSVDYATADGSATAGGDYSAANGTLRFQPGETQKTIPISVVSDTTIEPNETFTVTLSNPVNATIAKGTATASITNDDTAVPVTPGAYQGITQNGNYVFFTVLPDRTFTGFRINDLTETCEGGARLTGGVNFGNDVFRINADGRFAAEGSWTGSLVQGDIEWTSFYARLTGFFNTPTSVSGTIIENDELNYKGQHYRCSSGEVTWSATRRG